VATKPRNIILPSDSLDTKYTIKITLGKTMKTKLIIAATIISSLLISGCATSRSTLDIPITSATETSELNGKEIYINSVSDNRVFEVKPSTPNIPSLDPDEAQGDQIKLRAIARKRNGYGMGLGDILLPEGKTVESLITASIQKELINNGYTVITNKESISNNTYIVDVSINKLWSWMNPGFFSISLSAEISTDIAISHESSTDKKIVSVTASDNYQVATDSNWAEIIQIALGKYSAELKQKL
jgi:hypothetical protein